MKIDITPKMLVSVGAALLMGGSMIVAGEDVIDHLLVEPRVAALEDHKNCQSCIDMCLERDDGSTREACFDECVTYGFCYMKKEEG